MFSALILQLAHAHHIFQNAGAVMSRTNYNNSFIDIQNDELKSIQLQISFFLIYCTYMYIGRVQNNDLAFYLLERKWPFQISGNMSKSETGAQVLGCLCILYVCVSYIFVSLCRIVQRCS
jgi:hypothetical protein